MSETTMTIAEYGVTVAKALTSSMKPLLPEGVDASKFLRQVVTAFEKIPKLADCDETSIKLAFLNVAGLGLDPSGMTGEAYVLPFKGKATPVIAARGYISLALRSGAVLSIDHGVVCEGDEFDFEQGSKPFVHHKRTFKNRGDAFCWYAVATLPSGAQLVELMSLGEIERIAQLSPSGKSGPWGNHFDEMGRKTVLRRLCKRIPWNGDIAAKMTEAHIAEDAEIYDAETVGKSVQTPRERLSAVMNSTQTVQTVEAVEAAEMRAEPVAAAEVVKQPEAQQVAAPSAKKTNSDPF